MDYWLKAKKYGIDISLLDLTLSKTVMERVWEHQRALDLMLALQEAGGRYYAKLSKAHRKPGR